MKASDAIAHVLSANNVDFGFELIGGMIAHLVDSINLLGKTKLVSVHHEQAAAFAAGGIARATGNQKIGLALGTSGPGATNLITGIADCWLDSSPCIFITGQVNTNELKGERNIRQQGFQELDIVSIVKSITKYAYQIKHQDEIIPCLQHAIDVATSGRLGPVLIDIPMNLQRAELDKGVIDYLKEKKEIIVKKDSNSFSDFAKIIELLNKSKKPLFLIGGGAINAENFIPWQSFLSKEKIPHVASLKGSEKTLALPGYFGMIGSYGTRTANYALQHADLVIVVGSRLDVRQTGADTDDFARNAKVVQIDIDQQQIDNRIKGYFNVVASSEEFFSYSLDNNFNGQYDDWFLNLNKHWGEMFIDEYEDLNISPFKMCKILNSLFDSKKIHYVTDVGNNQMWAAHSLRLSSGQAIHNSGGLGAMGFGIPTAIGVSYAIDGAVVVITGDGGAQLNIQELDIIAREKLPILTIVLNNDSLGMVRAFQDMYFDGRDDSTYWNGYSSSFARIGKAYNIISFTIATDVEFSKYISDFIANPRPMLIEVLMSDARECRPRLAFGNPIDKQFPYK
ncbi:MULTISPECIES: thiamine pyrophosphate-binding protein [Yersinia]|uniref:thiamine pyrophosphate-binding protein n=1 Tax=Yersinia TaxID=629 RepID=UPI0009B71344|nr:MULTISPECIES: thiamine pyrophosphate-binding protein [Yersinia]ARB86063.1 thiamine pyrophosphate-binding protein [Yersinia sp. FDAARGOS_228]AVL35912.1 thiamine pyrophosphate-binding protein [Yersinia intermedia]